jgi:hypothetical protein
MKVREENGGREGTAMETERGDSRGFVKIPHDLSGFQADVRQTAPPK